jgi:LAGLIDADG endonuclease
MRMPGQALHKVPLFGWAIFVTAVLLLLALPVLAGIIINILPALNKAMCWKFLLIFILIRQSARNQKIFNFFVFFRDYTPEFICYKYNLFKKYSVISPKNDNNNVNNSNEDFSFYLTGLIEGDGTIYVPKVERSIKGKLNYPSVQIVFDLRDFPLAQVIQQRLGHGSLTRKKGVNAYVLTINNYEGILLIVSLINGCFKTPKISSLHKLIDWINNKYNLSIDKKEINNNIFNNAWLSGFIDADGHFSVRTTLNTKYPRIECKFELVQRKVDHNNNDNYYFLKKIADLLYSDVKPIRITKPHPEYRVRTTSLKGNYALIKYLDKYPLYSSKYLNYLDWLLVLNYFINKEQTKKESIEKIVKIKLRMNNRRTEFNWNHLNKFYNLYK